ncbi:MAG: hypothetical protein Q9163_001582 [Psora crenata]
MAVQVTQSASTLMQPAEETASQALALSFPAPVQTSSDTTATPAVTTSPSPSSNTSSSTTTWTVTSAHTHATTTTSTLYWTTTPSSTTTEMAGVVPPVPSASGSVMKYSNSTDVVAAASVTPSAVTFSGDAGKLDKQRTSLIYIANYKYPSLWILGIIILRDREDGERTM